ncbi:MAG: LLM class flavin-dependent oxidoreductase [Chloroflexi bacterium]|nr:LLM class flavin-dependent oxidoreductase [Chloroflexota bacterium]
MPSVDVFMCPDFGYPAFVESAKLAEQHGFENFWLIDSTDAHSDYCPWAGLVAVNTSRIRIGPGVTNPLTRHPRVTANHMLTIHELSKGRAVLGLGAGSNATRTLGWQPARHSVMREATEVIRNKFKEKKADIPIYLVAGGPLNTKLAFQMADGVIGAGAGGMRSSPEGLLNSLQRLKAAAKEVGRDFSSVPVTMNVAGGSISHNRKEALEDMKGLFASSMRNIFVDRRSSLPPELQRFREEAQRATEAYDTIYHFQSHMPDGQPIPPARFISDEFADELAKLSGFVGTPQEVLPKFKAYWQVASQFPNVGFFVVPHGSRGGRMRSFELFVKEILPKLRS